ncbi:homocysteine S-methyltransferase [Chitinivorax tropicus]|uniref:S-methylmethionine:homocysteine methyltransferase n=1 Tax=Chitinivorax tropicus TaxID=714531 RepID=A0A840MHF7_9PROT|nr:homocysteine S-methyltransferase [Chitinivorax tropicus]MBB5017820.1 homocysteine S-methyltransferase [Chitinivorax tropicus]
MSTPDHLAAIQHQQALIVLDGALATELERRGAKLQDRLWSARMLIDNPALIEQVHLDYLLAGANIVTTASYQATFAGLAARGLDRGQASAVLARSVQLARSARARFMALKPHEPLPLVAASVGPYGAYLANGDEYRGQYGLSDQALWDFHHDRIATLLAAGADLLAFETIPSLQEARVLSHLLNEAFPQAWAWLSFSCRDEVHIAEGNRLDECMDVLSKNPQLLALGVNCLPPAWVPTLLAQARQATAKPLLAYPNSGERYDAVHKTWAGSTDPQAFGEAAHGWQQAGANWIGGCCRTTPADIAAISQWARTDR